MLSRGTVVIENDTDYVGTKGHGKYVRRGLSNLSPLMVVFVGPSDLLIDCGRSRRFLAACEPVRQPTWRASVFTNHSQKDV